MTTGDTTGAPRRNIKPQMTMDQQKTMARAVDKVREANNDGQSTENIAKNLGGSVWDIRDLMDKTSDSVDMITTLVVHGSMKIELAVFLGISPAKQQTLKDVLDIQKASGLQALNISPKALDDLCRGLSKELVAKIDGVDYSAPEKPKSQDTPKFTSAEEILAFMNRKPEPVRKSGPVSRVWSYATHSGKTILDLLNVLPESIGKTSSAGTTAGRPKDKDESESKGTGRPKDKDESEPKGGRPSDKDETDDGMAGAKTRKPTKAQLKAHIEKLNGEADASLKKQLLDGLKGGKSVDWVMEMLAEAGLPTP